MPEIKDLCNIIMVTYNRIEYTKITLESLLRNTSYEPHELIVVDNNSTDGTVDYLRGLEQGGKINRLILNPENIGLAFAINKGFESARGGFIAISENDVLYPPRWLETMLDYIIKIPELGVISSVNHYRQLLGDKYRANLKLLHGIEIDLEQNNVPNGSIVFRRELFEKVGKFRRVANRVFGGEDWDFCQRVRKAGYIVANTPDLLVEHLDMPNHPLSLRYTTYLEHTKKMLRLKGIDAEKQIEAEKNWKAGEPLPAAKRAFLVKVWDRILMIIENIKEILR